jgi:hypothetical protein
MQTLIEASVWGANIIPTILLVFVLVYWLTVVLGFADLEAFDIDIDIETEVNTDMSAGWLNHVLYFFNLGQVPLMLFLSFLALPMWLMAIIVTDLLGQNSVVLSFALLLPNFVLSLLIAKILTQPFVTLFDKLEREAEDNIQIIGKVCRVMLNASEDKLGQARLEEHGSVLVLNVLTRKGTTLQKGQTGLVIDYVAEKGCYVIEPYESVDISIGA